MGNINSQGEYHFYTMGAIGYKFNYRPISRLELVESFTDTITLHLRGRGGGAVLGGAVSVTHAKLHHRGAKIREGE